MSKEAMTLALEALEAVTKEMLALRDELAERGGRPTTNVFHQRLWDSSHTAYADKAIPAAITALREALAEQPAQQEPVAWMHPDGRVWTFGRGLDKSTFTIPLYAPPPAQRKPLTDEQIDKLPWGPHEGNPVTFAEGLRDFARAIEAAHGIKENT